VIEGAAAMTRLQDKYSKEIVPAMMKKFHITNHMAVPRLKKITVSMGVGKATQEKKRIDAAAKELGLITGQKPVITKARMSVAGFKVRQGMPIGCAVTLRGRRMYEFLDRLISVAIPRIRDFRGVPAKSFDGRGSYSMGLTEQIVFPEVNIDQVEFPQGMNIAMHISGGSDEQSYELLNLFGMPFRR
jgi:large subunit ribosomal protein L5